MSFREVRAESNRGRVVGTPTPTGLHFAVGFVLRRWVVQIFTGAQCTPLRLVRCRQVCEDFDGRTQFAPTGVVRFREVREIRPCPSDSQFASLSNISGI